LVVAKPAVKRVSKAAAKPEAAADTEKSGE
jgi:hypothetical protein